jgi:hypothetical protein
VTPRMPRAAGRPPAVLAVRVVLGMCGGHADSRSVRTLPPPTTIGDVVRQATAESADRLDDLSSRVIGGRFPALSCTDNADGDVSSLHARTLKRVVLMSFGFVVLNPVRADVVLPAGRDESSVPPGLSPVPPIAHTDVPTEVQMGGLMVEVFKFL